MNNIPVTSKAGFNVIKQHEGRILTAYKCPAGIWTIGFGNTYYEDGTRVKEGDKITAQRAEDLFRNTLKIYEQAVWNLTRDDINQNQFDALVSFAYNVGIAALQKSTLLKHVNENPNDKRITTEFKKWIRGGGKVLPGLVKRRQQESDFYFNGVVKENMS